MLLYATHCLCAVSFQYTAEKKGKPVFMAMKDMVDQKPQYTSSSSSSSSSAATNDKA